MKVNFTNVKMTLDSIQKEDKEEAQTSNCLLTNVNLPIDNKQNDFIKENLKEKEKENMEEITQPAVEIISSTESFLEEMAKGDCLTNPIPVEMEWIRERYNNHEWECYNTIGVFRWRVDGKYYTVKKK